MAQGFLYTLEPWLTLHPNGHHNMWKQGLDSDLGARPARALDLLPLRNTDPFICSSTSSFTLFSLSFFFIFQHLTSLKFFPLVIFFFRREHKTFTSSLTSLCQPEIPGTETCLMLLPPCPMHLLLPTKGGQEPIYSQPAAKQQAPLLKKHRKVQIPQSPPMLQTWNR